MNEILFSKSGNTIVGDSAHELYFKHKEKIEILRREIIAGSDSPLMAKANYRVIDSDCQLIASTSFRDSALRYCNAKTVLLSNE